MELTRITQIAGIGFILSIAVACTSVPQDDLSREQSRWIEVTLKRMTIEQKVGQLLAPSIRPPQTGADSAVLNRVAEWISKYHIGHLYITGNRLDPVGTARFINAIQGKTEVPLLIHSGLEAGLGGRFDGGTILPPLMGLAQTGSETLVYEAAVITAKEAGAVGIHLVDSPVLDVNTNPHNPVISIRSFGDQAELVTILGKAYVKGLNDQGMLGAAKHFPGHGDVAIDSHSKMPTITASRRRLDSVEFYPYRQIIPAGLRAVMTAHISVPAIDPTPGLPATLSRPVLSGVLRDELGFDGLLITDAFDMSGILESGSFEESALKAVLAGNDVVLLWREPRFEQVYPRLLKAVEEGEISRSRLDESVRRVLIAKARAGLHHEKYVDLDQIPSKVNIPEHREMAREIQKRSVVLVKNEGEIVPLPGKNKSIAVLTLNDDENHMGIGETFIQKMLSRGNVVSVFRADPTTPIEVLNKAGMEAQKSEVIVVGLFARIFARRGSASLMHEQLIQILRDLSGGNIPVFVVSFGTPYLITQFPAVNGYMISTEPTWEFYGYDTFRPGQIAAAEALFGEVDITGTLSVSIPGLYSFGHGIRYTPSTDK